MTEPMSQPVFLVVDKDASAVEMLTADLARRFHADYRVVGETSAVGEGSVAIPQVHRHLLRLASRAAS